MSIKELENKLYQNMVMTNFRDTINSVPRGFLQKVEWTGEEQYIPVIKRHILQSRDQPLKHFIKTDKTSKSAVATPLTFGQRFGETVSLGGWKADKTGPFNKEQIKPRLQNVVQTYKAVVTNKPINVNVGKTTTTIKNPLPTVLGLAAAPAVGFAAGRAVATLPAAKAAVVKGAVIGAGVGLSAGALIPTVKVRAPTNVAFYQNAKRQMLAAKPIPTQKSPPPSFGERLTPYEAVTGGGDVGLLPYIKRATPGATEYYTKPGGGISRGSTPGGPDYYTMTKIRGAPFTPELLKKFQDTNVSPRTVPYYSSGTTIYAGGITEVIPNVVNYK